MSEKALKLGRGQKAPYETTHYRIPKPIKPIVEQISEDYKRSIFAGEDSEEIIKKISRSLEDKEPAIGGIELERAVALLTEALTLKPQAGGAIKAKIREALVLLKLRADGNK